MFAFKATNFKNLWAPDPRKPGVTLDELTDGFVTLDTPGACYLALFRRDIRKSVFESVGLFPQMQTVMRLQGSFHKMWKSHKITVGDDGIMHVDKGGFYPSLSFKDSRMAWLQASRLKVGAAPVGTFGRLFHATFSQFQLSPDAGQQTSDALDAAIAGSLNGHLAQLSRIPSVRVPMNLPEGAQKALFNLFGRYQLDVSGPAVGHPASDTFRRLATNYVFDQVGAANIVEIGPSLSRMARDPSQCADHSCSPNIDGRDRARAILAAHQVGPNHPHAADLRARANGAYPNPGWMCGNLGQNCNVQGNVLLAMFSLQDAGPAQLVEMMRSHGTHLAYVALSLPVALDYVNVFHDVDTGHRWVRDGDVATCFPGPGAAGYRHSLSKLREWTSGFNCPLFVEVQYQYGCDVLMRITLNDNLGTENYPLLVKSTLDKYTFISGSSPSCPDFLTSAAQYDRLVSYLTTNHGRFDNLFKAAMDRIAVLTPAIVLGSQKHTDRWELSLDERIAVALAACTDVQRTLQLSNVAQKQLEVTNSKLATAARRELVHLEPSLVSRFASALRGESSISSEYGVFDFMADFVECGRKATSLHSAGALPPLTIVPNGLPGHAEIAVNPPAPRAQQGPPPPAATRATARALVRNGYPAPQPWHVMMDEFWLSNLPAGRMPVPREARLLDNFQPDVNLTAAQAHLAAMPVSNLTLLQRQALDNWDYSPATRIDLLLVGPAGTGKSTHARRIAPAGTLVITPTNELAQSWLTSYPGHVVLTLDQACANIGQLITATCIIIDELYQMPAGHVITFASLGVPVIALGCPAQRLYSGGLGAGASHANIPVDYAVLLKTVQRNGADITAVLNRRALHIYARAFALGPQERFVSANPGRQCFQRRIIQTPGLHLTAHVDNTNVYPGCITIDSSQGTQEHHVYVHLFPGDIPYFQANPYAFELAVTRCTDTCTITIPRGNPQLTAFLQQKNVPFTSRGLNVFGHWTDLDARHTITDFHDAEPERPQPSEECGLSETAPSDWLFRHDPVTDFDAAIFDMPPDLPEALNELHPFVPNPETLQPTTALVLRRPDPRLRVNMPELEATVPFFEASLFPHIGYPFTNTELASSIFAIFDRYTKPQNRRVTPRLAAAHADIMFDNWLHAFIRPEARVEVPTTASLMTNWFSARTAKSISEIERGLPNADSSQLVKAFYFLKAQGKPKFGKYAHALECGQGIIASDKSLNAATCPFITAATKVTQLLLKANVIYDSGYTAEELDRAVLATKAHHNPRCLSIDLSQQDSSHIITHRLFIAKVLNFLGFGDTVVGAYLLWREKRTVVGQAVKMLFEVLERLFSGEPGTAFFNWLMSTGTTASSHDLSRFLLFLGKGDDNTVVPPPPKKKSAFNVIRETGVTQKCAILPYLDFANRIWTTSGRSFADPARLVAKYTMRLTPRVNTEEEIRAFREQRFTPDGLQFDEIVQAVSLKHDISVLSADTIARAASALYDPTVYTAWLRPSKIPADRLPVIRRCCRLNVVHENREDQCAVSAIAFLADVPIEDVRLALANRRTVVPIHPDVRDANSASPFAGANFVHHDELLWLCSKFSVPWRKPVHGLRLHICSGHVSVVRTQSLAPYGRSHVPLGQYRLYPQKLVYRPSSPLQTTKHGFFVALGAVFISAYISWAWPRLGLFAFILLVASILLVLGLIALWRLPRQDDQSPAARNVRHYGSVAAAAVLVPLPLFSSQILLWVYRAAAFAHLCYSVWLERSLLPLLKDLLSVTGVQDFLEVLGFLSSAAFYWYGLWFGLFIWTFMPVMFYLAVRGRHVLHPVIFVIVWVIDGAFLYFNTWRASPALIPVLVSFVSRDVARRLVLDCLRIGDDICIKLLALSFTIPGLRLLLPTRILFTADEEESFASKDKRYTDRIRFLRDHREFRNCFTTLMQRKGKAARKFWKYCHPDKLSRIYGRLCVGPLEVMIGRGRPLNPSELPDACLDFASAQGTATASSAATSATIAQTVTSPVTAATSSAVTMAASTPTVLRTAFTSLPTPPPGPTLRSLLTSDGHRYTVIGDLKMSLSYSPLRHASTAHSFATSPAPQGLNGLDVIFIVLIVLIVALLVTSMCLCCRRPRPNCATRPRPSAPTPEGLFCRVCISHSGEPCYGTHVFIDEGRLVQRRIVLQRELRARTIDWIRAGPHILRQPTAFVRDQIFQLFAARPHIRPADYVDPPTTAAPAPRLRPVPHRGPRPTRARPTRRADLAPLHLDLPERFQGPAHFTDEQRRVFRSLIEFSRRARLPSRRTDALRAFEHCVQADTIPPGMRFFPVLLRRYLTTHLAREPDVCLSGIAGCAKSTLYLHLAEILNIVVVVPTNELRDDLLVRMNAMGVVLTVVTQHAVFELDLAGTDLLIIDEAFTLPHYHIAAICGLHHHTVICGDPFQLVDMGYGADHTDPLRPECAAIQLELTTSFTVPQDVLELAIRNRLIPAHWRTVSTVRHSIIPLGSSDVLPANVMCVCGSRECAVGGRLSAARQRTIFTSQGSRFPEVVFHVCERDHSAIDAGADHQQRSGLIWTAISRHTRVLYLDLCLRFLVASEFIAVYSEDQLRGLARF